MVHKLQVERCRVGVFQAAIEFTTIAKSGMDGPAKAEQKVITMAKDWEAAWKGFSRAAAPKVDFDKECVIIVAMGQKPSSGYAIEITGLKAANAGIMVQYKESAPGPNDVVAAVITNPFHIIRTAKVNVPFKFVKDTGK